MSKKLEDTVNALAADIEELKKRMKQVEDEIARAKRQKRWI